LSVIIVIVINWPCVVTTVSIGVMFKRFSC